MDIRLLSKRSLRRSLPQVSLLVLIVVAGTIPAVASSSPARARHGVSGVAARVMVLNLTTKAHVVGRPGHIDNVKGTVSGTISGTTSIRFVAVGSTSGEGTFTIYPKSGGTLYGRSQTHGRVVGPTAYFSGTSSITGGTGPYAHAHGTGLTFSGTLNRQDYRSTSVTHGKISV